MADTQCDNLFKKKNRSLYKARIVKNFFYQKQNYPNNEFLSYRTDPASGGWASSWMSGIALGVLGICLVGGAIFAVFWARRNKRIMKASYPGRFATTTPSAQTNSSAKYYNPSSARLAGPTLTTMATLPDKQHSLWLHGNTLLKPMHTIAPPQMPSEYAEVTQTMMPKLNPQLQQSAPPEPYATVTLQRGAQSDDSCIKCSASPSSSEYNAPVREPLNLCDVLPPPPDHPYGSYKPPNSMTIRTNPAAMSPQVQRRIPPTPPRWGTQPPPIPTFPQNWSPDSRQLMPIDVDNNQDCYSENDYESGSVLYEQCSRPEETGYFMRGGEPTEEYYRNINMEFLEEQDFEPSTPPPPCPDSYSRNHSNLRLLGNGQDSPLAGKRTLRTPQQQQQIQLQQQQLQQQQLVQQLQQQQQQLQLQQSGTPSGQSSDSESDNRWAPRSRRSRSRSKSGDRKYLRNGGHVR